MMKKAIYMIMMCMFLVFMGIGISHAVFDTEGSSDTPDAASSQSVKPGMKAAPNSKARAVTIERDIIGIDFKSRILKTENGNYPLASDFTAYQRRGDAVYAVPAGKVKDTEGLIHLINEKVKWVTIEE